MVAECLKASYKNTIETMLHQYRRKLCSADAFHKEREL